MRIRCRPKTRFSGPCTAMIPKPLPSGSTAHRALQTSHSSGKLTPRMLGCFSPHTPVPLVFVPPVTWVAGGSSRLDLAVVHLYSYVGPLPNICLSPSLFFAGIFPCRNPGSPYLLRDASFLRPRSAGKGHKWHTVGVQPQFFLRLFDRRRVVTRAGAS